MPKKKTTASEPIVSGGAAPVRARKHAPAKRTTAAAVESSPSITPTAEINQEVHSSSSYSVVTFDDVAKLAYSYWEARGCQGGSPDEDWLRAEQELNAKFAIAGV
jgi:Protein of unknown function (DUF2934)